MKKLIFTLLLLILATTAFAEEKIIFKGIPNIKQDSLSKKVKISNEEAINLICIITKDKDKYHWSSRENIELIPTKSGECFITFLAVNGTGYIKIRNKENSELCKDVISDYGYEKYDYVEHLSIGFSSITYYGAEK